MNSLLVICALMGYGFSYDGYSEQNLLFQINTPEASYGIVVSLEKPSVYCDMIYYKNIEQK